MRLKNVKRVVSFIIAMTMIMTLVPSVFAASVEDFADFPTGWSNEAMTAAVNNGLLNGRSATEIVPEGELTRAEMVTIINRAFGATIEANITSYLDVPANSWYYHEIAKGVNMQTIQGDSASIMRPEDAITREEVFTIIARALVLEDEEAKCLEKFPDGEEVSDWARKYICPLISRDYLHGDENGYLMPKKNITREEFAQVMHNIVKTYFSEEGTYSTTGPDSTLIRKSDANLSNVTVEGDLIIGDGVGYGTVTLTNVTIKGRLLCRGGEKAIKLINTTVGDKVVVKDVNGTVHFENYRDEKVFNDILLITNATFLTRTSGGGGGSSRPRPSATYYTVKFFDGMVKDADSIASKRVKKDESLKDTDEDLSIDDIYNGEGVATTGNEITYRWDGKELYDGTFTHTVAPEYIFYNEVTGDWEVFTEDTVLTAELVGTDKVLEVYYAYKNIAAYLTNLVPVDALRTVSVNADYSSDSRVADTVKVLMINGRDQLEFGKSAIDSKQREMFELLGNKTGGVITPEGIINLFPVDLKIVDVIDSEEVRNTIISYVSESETIDLEILAKIMDEFINDSEFTITTENKKYAEAVAYKVGNFEYEEIRPRLVNKGYGKIIELIGDDVFAEIFNESKTEYSEGLLEEIAEVDADETYKTSLTVKVDVVSIIKNLYTKGTEKAKALFQSKSIYKYDENDALQALVNIDWFNVFIKPTNDGRYQVSDFFSMYDAMLDTFILIDEAICWYGNPDNYPESDYTAVKTELADDINAYIDSVMNIFDQITSGEAIGGKYTINDLIDKVDELNDVVGTLGDSSAASYGDSISSLVDTLTDILTNLGEGELPGGVSLDTVNSLCEKLKEVLNNISDEEYEAVNAILNSKIKAALVKVDAVLDELDEDGTIRGKSIEGLFNKFAFVGDLFDQYWASFKNIIGLMANADIDETEVDIDSEWMVDIFFGADEDNRFTVDNIMDIAPDKLMTEVNDYTETADETYIVDYYQVKAGDASIKAQRTIR